MNDSKDFQDAESVRSGTSTLPVDQCHSHLMRYLEGCCDILLYRRASEKGRQAFGTHMVYRETFLQIHMLPLQLPILKNWINWIRPRSRSIQPQWRKVKGQNKIEIWDANLDRQPRIQSSSVEETLSRIMVQINNDCRSQVFTTTNSVTPATFACWKIRFKTQVCTCSQFPTEAMQWIKEVEMVDSVDDFIHVFVINQRNSNAEFSSTRCEDCFSTEQKSSIILTSKEESVWRNKRPRKRTVSFAVGRLLTESIITSGSLESMILSKTMPTYSLSDFEMMIFRNSIWSGTEFYYLWRKIPSEKLKTVLELYDLETHQKKIGPDYHRLKTMLKRSIEQEIRNKNFGIRNGNYEKNAVVKNQGTKQRVQRILGYCWQWETNGQCVKGDNCSFSPRYE